MAGQDGNPGNPLGLQTPGFNASFAFFLVFMGPLGFPHPPIYTYNSRFFTRKNEWEKDKANAKVSAYTGLICFIFLICSLRTNIVFFLIFFTLVGAFGCLAAAYWNLALAYENAENTAAAKRAGRLVVVRLPLFPSLPSLPSFSRPTRNKTSQDPCNPHIYITYTYFHTKKEKKSLQENRADTRLCPSLSRNNRQAAPSPL